MSQLTKSTPNIVARYEIRLSDVLKDAMQLITDEMRLTREALVDHKANTAVGSLLNVMQAANDSDGVIHYGENVKPELKQLGQWVFEGQDEKYVSAAVDGNGDAHLYPVVKESLWFSPSILVFCVGRPDYLKLKGKFVADDWQQSAINRVPINDVDYLSNNDLDDSVPHIDDVLALPNWLSDSVPQITQADLQFIFIKNLSECLIQRMHSMDRFSDDDYAIGGNKLMAWDIVVGKPYKTKEEDHNVVRFGVISCQSRDLKVLEVLSFNESYCNSRGESLAVYFSENNTYRTITEAELPAFRAALEACYA